MPKVRHVSVKEIKDVKIITVNITLNSYVGISIIIKKINVFIWNRKLNFINCLIK